MPISKDLCEGEMQKQFFSPWYHLQEHLRVFFVLEEWGDHNRRQNGDNHPGQFFLWYEVVEQRQTPVVYFWMKEEAVKSWLIVVNMDFSDKC